MTTDRADRRGIMGAVVDRYRDQVLTLVRLLVPESRRIEGEQIGVLGLIVGLELYKGDVPFWWHAMPFVRDEILAWAQRTSV